MRISTIRQVAARRVLVGTVMALAGSAALAASAWIRVPMWPVPMTMQTAMVLMMAAALGPRLGAAAVLAYLIEGAVGLPVLAGASVVGPTAGYLVGFLLATVAVGFAAERGWMRRPVALVAVLLAAEVLIYLPGLAWLDLGWTHNLQAALAGGLLPFLPGEATKLALAAAVLHAVRRD